jgi:nucleoside-diphosphate kinase
VVRTFAMIKPDAVAAGFTGPIIEMIEKRGFTIVSMEKRMIDRATAQQFYAVHSKRPFFTELVDFVTSGPVVAMVLEKDDAVKQWRDLMGMTNPCDAAEGTVRKIYGSSIGRNAVHGSDAPETAVAEIQLFFPDCSV